MQIKNIKKKYLAIILVLAAIVAAALVIDRRPGNSPRNQPPIDNQSAATTDGANISATSSIASFEECLAAGMQMFGVKPFRRCVVSDDLAYVEIENCAAPDGTFINIYTARQLFDNGKCAWEGSANMESRYCDQAAGIWMIGIDAYRKDCQAFCAINVVAKTTEVVWECVNENK